MIKQLEDKLIMCEYEGMTRKELEEFADRMRVDRNSFIVGKNIAEDKIIELETELYFCNRNNRIEELVNED